MTALTLPFPDLVIPPAALSHREAAAEFAAANPGLMRWLTDEALAHKHDGIDVGIKYLIEKARVGYLRINRTGEFRINNSWSAYLGRIVMDDCPELAGYFRCREVRS